MKLSLFPEFFFCPKTDRFGWDARLPVTNLDSSHSIVRASAICIRKVCPDRGEAANRRDEFLWRRRATKGRGEAEASSRAPRHFSGKSALFGEAGAAVRCGKLWHSKHTGHTLRCFPEREGKFEAESAPLERKRAHGENNSVLFSRHKIEVLPCPHGLFETALTGHIMGGTSWATLARKQHECNDGYWPTGAQTDESAMGDTKSQKATGPKETFVFFAVIKYKLIQCN